MQNAWKTRTNGFQKTSNSLDILIATLYCGEDTEKQVCLTSAINNYYLINVTLLALETFDAKWRVEFNYVVKKLVACQSQPFISIL